MNKKEWSPFAQDLKLAVCGDDTLIGLPFGCPIPSNFKDKITARTNGTVSDSKEDTMFFQGQLVGFLIENVFEIMILCLMRPNELLIGGLGAQ